MPPSAGPGALLALLLTGNDLSIVAMIGSILLLGIVKKNAITMVDFTLETEREEGQKSEDAIYQACIVRFRPIMMTMAALLGAVPLAVGIGTGSEPRKPLDVAMVGGRIVSQLLTLYTTLVGLPGFRAPARGRLARPLAPASGPPAQGTARDGTRLNIYERDEQRFWWSVFPAASAKSGWRSASTNRMRTPIKIICSRLYTNRLPSVDEL